MSLFPLLENSEDAPQTPYIKRLDRWGYPVGSHVLIGIVELAGAVLLFVPKLSRYAEMALGCVMLGALAIHLVCGEFSEVFRGGIYLVLVGGLIILRKR